MRVILGLPNVAKLSEKDSCNATIQGQEMEISKSLNRREKCGGCASPTQRRKESAQISIDACSMQNLLFADEDGCQCEQDVCCKCSEDIYERGHHHGNAYSLAEERDCLLPKVGERDDHQSTPADIQRRMSPSQIDPTKISHCETVRNYDRTLPLADQNCGDTKDSQRDCSRECSGDHPEALPALSSLPCPSAMMSSPFLPSSTVANHLNASLPTRPMSQPLTSELVSDHSTHVAAKQVPIFCKDDQRHSRVAGSPSGEEAEECFVIVNEGDLEEFCQSGFSRAEHRLQHCAQATRQNGITPISMTSLGSLSSGDGPICRICHEGPTSDEDMLAPCHCSGTLTYQHRRCLEQWLQTRGKDACELCDFHFKTERKGRPFSEWIRQPERIRDRRNILTDCSCFALLTPLVCVSTWLCLNGAYHYLSFYEGRGWESIGLIALASVLIFIYLFWSLMSMRYHCIVWRTWRKEHQRVHIVMDTKDSENNNNDISLCSSKCSRLPGSCTPSVSPSCTHAQKKSQTPSPKSVGSLSPTWASPDSYQIPLQAPLASMTSL